MTCVTGGTRSASQRRWPSVSEVVAVLDRNRDEIAEVWARSALLTVKQLSSTRLSEAKAWSVKVLAAMSEAILTQSYQTLDSYVCQSVVHLCAQGADISSSVLAWEQARVAVLNVLRSAYPGDAELVLECSAQLDGCLDHCTALCSRKCLDEIERALLQRQARIQWMLDAGRAAGSSLDLSEVLSHLVQTISTALATPSCLLAATNADRGTVLFRQAASTGLFVTDPGVRRWIPDHDVGFEHLDALGSQVLTRGEPLFSTDAFGDASSLPFSTALGSRPKSVLGLPFVANGRVVALAWAMAWDDCHVFRPEDVNLAQGVANVGALAIANAHAHQQVKQRTIIEERGRMSREIHDNLSQSLGLLKMKSALASEFLAGHDLDEVDLSLREMHDIAASTYTDAREAIHGLRSIELADTEFVSVLERFMSTYRAGFGLDVSLEVRGRDAIAPEPEVGVQALSVIQEALSNVRKHARAGSVRVLIEPADTGLHLSVEDDGQGFDAAAASQDEAHGVGLCVMRERAESVGGHLDIDSTTGQGTRVHLWVPQVRPCKE